VANPIAETSFHAFRNEDGCYLFRMLRIAQRFGWLADQVITRPGVGLMA
jgi:hypothetical protein